MKSKIPLSSDRFLDDLLNLIQSGTVIPIIGWNVLSIGPDDEPLESWLATKLANSLGISLSPSNCSSTLSDVVSTHLLAGRPREVIYTTLHRLLRDFCPEPGRTLYRLASIRGLRNFITTTFDPLLAKALNDTHFDGEQRTRVYSYSPRAESKDLPYRFRELSGPTVYHILGQSSQVCDFAVWEEDIMEFVLGLHGQMRRLLPNLSKDLADPHVHFLILGLNFSDWLTRFFIRATRQNRFIDGFSRLDYIADSHEDLSTDKNLVMFLRAVDNKIKVIPGDPRKFVGQLADRWQQLYSPEPGQTEHPSDTTSSSMQRSCNGVFLSYAHEDAEAAWNLKSGLEDHNIRVWFDKDRLVSGVNFDNHLEDAVKEHCWPFISMVSKTTESMEEAYFHQERNWAAERANRFSDWDRGEYYHPVIIDREIEPEQIKREPRAFRSSHIVKLPGGQVTGDFAHRIIQLIRSRRE